MVSLFAVLFLSLAGGGCPHQGTDHRLLGRIGCPLQRKLTIENAPPPRTIWSFRLHKVSVKIDPKHPHLLVEWPTKSPRWWRFRMGYRWDANAKAYIFPTLALKKVDGPMLEYQKASQHPLKPTDASVKHAQEHAAAAVDFQVATFGRQGNLSGWLGSTGIVDEHACEAVDAAGVRGKDP